MILMSVLSLATLFENAFPQFIITLSLISATPCEYNTGSETLLLLISYMTIHSGDEGRQRLLRFGNLHAAESGMLFLPLICKGWFKLSFQILKKDKLLEIQHDLFSPV